jgi:hypothetical protein
MSPYLRQQTYDPARTAGSDEARPLPTRFPSETEEMPRESCCVQAVCSVLDDAGSPSRSRSPAKAKVSKKGSRSRCVLLCCVSVGCCSSRCLLRLRECRFKRTELTIPLFVLFPLQLAIARQVQIEVQVSLAFWLARQVRSCFRLPVDASGLVSCVSLFICSGSAAGRGRAPSEPHRLVHARWSHLR